MKHFYKRFTFFILASVILGWSFLNPSFAQIIPGSFYSPFSPFQNSLIGSSIGSYYYNPYSSYYNPYSSLGLINPFVNYSPMMNPALSFSPFSLGPD